MPWPLRWPCCTLTRLEESEARVSSCITEGEVRNSTLPRSATAIAMAVLHSDALEESEACVSSCIVEGGVRISTHPLSAMAIALAVLHSDARRGIGSACVFMYRGR